MRHAHKLFLVLAIFAVGTCAALPFLHRKPAADPATERGAEDNLPWREDSPRVLLDIQGAEAGGGPTQAATTGQNPLPARRPTIAKQPNSLDAVPLPRVASDYQPLGSLPSPGSLPSQVEDTPRGEREVKSSAPQRWHTIKDGDTLRGIAETYLGNGDRYLEIFQANRRLLATPHTLPIGTKIAIPSE